MKCHDTLRIMGKKGMLLVGHGSSLPYNKELVEETAAMIRARDGEFIIRVGFLNLDTPTLIDALDEFRKDDIDMMVVVPLFLAKGVHILEDIPALLGLGPGQMRGEIRLGEKSIPLVYAEPIGKDPLLAEMMLKNAYRAMRKTS
jgi:sirohydrochlorin cobaltochelatase